MTKAVICFLSVSLVYAFQAQGAIQQGYDIRSVEDRITTLEQEGQDLQLKLSELRSIERLEALVRERGLVAVTSIQYQSIEALRVAERASEEPQG
ncbi:MAG: hypothetical protein HY460_02750 [Parcubacteria group bacterium]|nr:hypothetical protein [Parcubacteria group bacterium]